MPIIDQQEKISDDRHAFRHLLWVAGILSIIVAVVVSLSDEDAEVNDRNPALDCIGSLSQEKFAECVGKIRVDDIPPVAAYKRSFGDLESLLLVVVGYPNNMSVCLDLVRPYNNGDAGSTFKGEYYCRILE